MLRYTEQSSSPHSWKNQNRSFIREKRGSGGENPSGGIQVRRQISISGWVEEDGVPSLKTVHGESDGVGG